MSAKAAKPRSDDKPLGSRRTRPNEEKRSVSAAGTSSGISACNPSAGSKFPQIKTAFVPQSHPVNKQVRKSAPVNKLLVLKSGKFNNGDLQKTQR